MSLLQVCAVIGKTDVEGVKRIFEQTCIYKISVEPINYRKSHANSHNFSFNLNTILCSPDHFRTHWHVSYSLSKFSTESEPRDYTGLNMSEPSNAVVNLTSDSTTVDINYFHFNKSADPSQQINDYTP